MQHLHPEAPVLIRILLAIHIAAGSVALFVVPIVLAVRRGGKNHRRFGIAFVYAMGIVALTAFVVAPYFRDYFLLLIAIFSSYLTFCGWRALARKRPEKQPATPIDWTGASLAAGAGLTMIGMGVFAHAFFAGFSIVLVILGAICTGAGVRSIIGQQHACSLHRDGHRLLGSKLHVSPSDLGPLALADGRRHGPHHLLHDPLQNRNRSRRTDANPRHGTRRGDGRRLAARPGSAQLLTKSARKR
jgi:hypothetical protein